MYVDEINLVSKAGKNKDEYEAKITFDLTNTQLKNFKIEGNKITFILSEFEALGTVNLLTNFFQLSDKQGEV
jgi:hypothetical protein